MWIEGTAAKGYLKEDLWEVFRRYIPKSEIEALRAESKAEDEKQNPNNPGAAGAAAA